MASEMMRHFEHDLLPQVTELLRRTPKPTPETGLVAYLTDAVCNAVNFDEVVNNVPFSKEMEDFRQAATPYLEYIEYYAIQDKFLRTILILEGNIKEGFSNNVLEDTNKMLELFVTKYFPKIDTILSLSKSETKKISDAVKQLTRYYKRVNTKNIDSIMNSTDAINNGVYTTYSDVFDSFGLGEIYMIYRDLLYSTYKEKSRYSLVRQDLFFRQWATYFSFSLAAFVTAQGRDVIDAFATAQGRDVIEDEEYTNVFKKAFVDWLNSSVDRVSLADTVNSLIKKPYARSVLVFQNLILPLGRVTGSLLSTKVNVIPVADKLLQLAGLADDHQYQTKIYEKIINALQSEHFEGMLDIYDEIISNVNFANVNFLTPYFMEDFDWAFGEGRCVQYTTKSNESFLADKQKILNIAATYNLSNMNMYHYLAFVHNIKTYINSFLGSDPDLANKVISNLGKYDSKELDLLQAVGKANQASDLTEEQHIMLERLIPRYIYIHLLTVSKDRGLNIFDNCSPDFPSHD